MMKHFMLFDGFGLYLCFYFSCILTLSFISKLNQKQQQLTQQMGGCTSINTHKLDRHNVVPTTQAKIGLLTIQVLSGYIHSHSGLYLLQPEAKFKISNFEFSAKIPKQSNKSLIESSSKKSARQSQSENSVIYTIPINSLYKFHGRALQIQIQEHLSKVQNYSGLGIMDLDPYLKQQCSKMEAKCFINYDRKSGGYVNMLISFEEVQSQLLLFRLDTIFINNSNRNRTIKARVTIGQQVLQTSYKTESFNSTPSWKNQILMFKIPKPVTCGSVQILEKVDGKQSKVIGNTVLDIEKFQYSEQRNIYKEQISMNGHLAGSILFEIIQTLEYFEQITQNSKGKIFISNVNGKLTSLNSLPKSSFKDLPRTETLIRNHQLTKTKAKTSNIYLPYSKTINKTSRDLNPFSTDQDLPETVNTKKKSRKHSKRISISNILDSYEKQNQVHLKQVSPSPFNLQKMEKKQTFSQSPSIAYNDHQSWMEKVQIKIFQP